jgi:hypothetical protein
VRAGFASSSALALLRVGSFTTGFASATRVSTLVTGLRGRLAGFGLRSAGPRRCIAALSTAAVRTSASTGFASATTGSACPAPLVTAASVVDAPADASPAGASLSGARGKGLGYIAISLGCDACTRGMLRRAHFAVANSSAVQEQERIAVRVQRRAAIEPAVRRRGATRSPSMRVSSAATSTGDIPAAARSSSSCRKSTRSSFCMRGHLAFSFFWFGVRGQADDVEAVALLARQGHVAGVSNMNSNIFSTSTVRTSASVAKAVP